jgi:hypothetical protein
MLRYANRFVAHFDMLGMRVLTKRKPALAWGAIRKLNDVRQRRLSIVVESKLDGTKIRIDDRVTCLMFSDTILIFTKGDEDSDLKSIVYLSNELFAGSLAASIPIRGGIAWGPLTHDPEQGLFVGVALVDAYEIGETAQWLGVVVDEVVASRSQAAGIEVTEDIPLIGPWNLRLRSGLEDTRQVFNWVASHRRNFTVAPPISARDFYAAFKQFFGPFESLTPEIRDKYSNTVDFVNAKISDFDSRG